jgi:hypothetical protein
VADLPSDQLSVELGERLQQADEFSRDPRLAAAFENAASDPMAWAEASRDPVAFLGEQGVELPNGLAIELLDDPLRGRPRPNTSSSPFGSPAVERSG